MQSSVLGLIKSSTHDFLGNALDLDIHLQCGNTLVGTSHFEVHIAKVILVAENICEDSEFFAFLNEAHRDAGNRCFDRHACIHQ